jgi:hypothetical protein
MRTSNDQAGHQRCSEVSGCHEDLQNLRGSDLLTALLFESRGTRLENFHKIIAGKLPGQV